MPPPEALSSLLSCAVEGKGGMSSPNFIDYVKLCVRSGKGGAGSLHFHRSKLNAKGGPDGGDGGRGGHVILRGNNHYWTLLHLKYRKHIIAEGGGRGAAQHRTGADGKDVILDVPLGVIARRADDEEPLCEVVAHGEEKVIARGGRGGRGNAFFVNSVNRTPQHAQQGEPGRTAWIILELKILADVGLIGFPNAGKSTLLSSVSAARPKIANYPFTTLTPHLGTVAYREGRSFVMADIPGIVEGAAEGKGLGLRFLRHAERNAILLFVIAADRLSIDKEYRLLLHELRRYNPALLDKRKALAVSKSDLLDEELTEAVRRELPKGLPTVFISAVSNLGLARLKDVIWQQLNAKPDT